MKHSLTVFSLILTFLTTPVCAQEPLDSLLSRMDDEISECLDNDRLDEARRLIDKALHTEGIRQSNFYHVMLYHEGTYHRNRGDFDGFKRNRLELLQMLPVEHLPELSISVPMDVGVIYRRDGQNDSALYYYDQALQAAVEQGDLEWQAAINLNVGVLHFNLNRLADAEGYLDRAVSQVRQVDDPYTEMCALQTDGAVKVMLKKPKDAEPLLRAAYALAQESESPDWQVRCITTMITMFDLLEQPDSSAFYTLEGNRLLPLLPPQGITATGYVTSRANHYCLNEQWAEAVPDYEAIMASGTGAVRTATVFEHMARCYSHLDRWPEAYAYMDSARIQADSVASERLTAQMADFQVKYQTMEKDLEISRLETQRLWLAVIAIAVLLVIAVAWLVYRQRHQRREAQMRISTLEEERRRIARELHDGLCNDMLALEMQLQFAAVGNASERCSDAVGNASERCIARLHELRHQARELSHQLMPPEFGHMSVAQLLRLYVEALNRATSVATTLHLPDGDTALSPQVSHELYRIVQEQTANIVKGGTATETEIHLEKLSANGYRLTIADNGTPTNDDNHQGLGHRTLNDRVTAIGGRSSTHRTGTKNVFSLEFSGQ